MTTAAPTSRRHWQPALSLPARLGLAALVVAAVTGAWWQAGQSSRDAVQHASQAMSRSSVHVTLPAVQVIGKREAVTPARRSAG